MYTFSFLKRYPYRGDFEKRWSPMFDGGTGAARKVLEKDNNVLECSIYWNMKFIKTVKKRSQNDE